MAKSILNRLDKETVEIMSNPETMKRIEESLEDIKHGRVKEISDVQDLLDEIED